LCRYPKADPTLIEPLLEQAVERMQHIILLGRQKRNQEKVKTKYPLRKLTVVHKERLLLDEISRLESYLLAELNVKEIGYHDAEEDYITLFARPNSPVLGKRLGKDFKHFKSLIDQLDSDTILALQQQGSITLDETRFVAEDILVFREAKPGTNAISDRYISIDLDCTLDENLIQEGLAREVVSRIQKSRKDVGLNVVDRIDLSIYTDPIIQQAVVAHLDYIKAETLCGQLAFVEDPAIQPQLSYPIDEHRFGLTISKRH
jgi:isoleucyl-tRNA synthetase